MSGADEKWTEDAFNQAFSNKPFEEITKTDFIRTSAGLSRREAEVEPSKRTFGGWAILAFNYPFYVYTLSHFKLSQADSRP